MSRYKDSVSAIFSISDLLQPRAEVKNAEQHGCSSFNTPAQFIIMYVQCTLIKLIIILITNRVNYVSLYKVEKI